MTGYEFVKTIVPTATFVELNINYYLQYKNVFDAYFYNNGFHLSYQDNYKIEFRRNLEDIKF